MVPARGVVPSGAPGPARPTGRIRSQESPGQGASRHSSRGGPAAGISQPSDDSCLRSSCCYAITSLQPSADQGALWQGLKPPATYNGIRAGPSQRGKRPRAGGQRSAQPRVGGPLGRHRSETLSPPMVPHSGSQAVTPASGKMLRQAQRRDGVWLFGGPFAACTRGPRITLRKKARRTFVSFGLHA